MCSSEPGALVLGLSLACLTKSLINSTYRFKNLWGPTLTNEEHNRQKIHQDLGIYFIIEMPLLIPKDIEVLSPDH